MQFVSTINNWFKLRCTIWNLLICGDDYTIMISHCISYSQKYRTESSRSQILPRTILHSYILILFIIFPFKVFSKVRWVTVFFDTSSPYVTYDIPIVLFCSEFPYIRTPPSPLRQNYICPLICISAKFSIT